MTKNIFKAIIFFLAHIYGDETSLTLVCYTQGTSNPNSPSNSFEFLSELDDKKSLEQSDDQQETVLTILDNHNMCSAVLVNTRNEHESFLETPDYFTLVNPYIKKRKKKNKSIPFQRKYICSLEHKEVKIYKDSSKYIILSESTFTLEGGDVDGEWDLDFHYSNSFLAKVLDDDSIFSVLVSVPSTINNMFFDKLIKKNILVGGDLSVTPEWMEEEDVNIEPIKLSSALATKRDGKTFSLNECLFQNPKIQLKARPSIKSTNTQKRLTLPALPSSCVSGTDQTVDEKDTESLLKQEARGTDFTIKGNLTVSFLTSKNPRKPAEPNNLIVINAKAEIPKRFNFNSDSIVVSGILCKSMFRKIAKYYKNHNSTRTEPHLISVIEDDKLHDEITKAGSVIKYQKITRYYTNLPIFSTFDNGEISLNLHPTALTSIFLSYEGAYYQGDKIYSYLDFVNRSLQQNPEKKSSVKDDLLQDCIGLTSKDLVITNKGKKVTFGKPLYKEHRYAGPYLYEEINEPMSIFSPRVIHSSSNPTSFSSTASVGPAAFGSGGSIDEDEIYDLFKDIDKAGEVSVEEEPSSSLTSTTAVTL